MTANGVIHEKDLVDPAIAWLRRHLPSDWEIERSGQPEIGTAPDALDATLHIRAPNGTIATVAVEARRSFTPRDVERMLPRLTQLIRSLAGNVPVLVVAPWLSERTRELLTRQR